MNGRIVLLWGALAALCVLALPVRSVSAQSLKDSVKKTVDEGIDDSKDKKKPKAEQKKAASKPKPKPKKKSKPKPKKKKKKKPRKRMKPGDADVTFELGKGVQDEKGDKIKLPHRFWPDHFKMDIKVGGGYRGWAPQQYDNVEVDVAHYATWNVDVKAKIFKFLTLHRGYYESNALKAPRNDDAAVAETVGSHAPKAAWLFGAIGFPFMKIWEPVIQYESRAFRTRAKATEGNAVCIVPRDDPPASLDPADCPPTDAELDIVSGFQTIVAGVRYNQNKDPDAVIREPDDKLPPMFFGIGLMQYEKPYQLTIDDVTLDEALFDARFRGAGLAFGTKIGGGVNRFTFKVDAQAGLGEVSLTEDLAVNDVLPADWVVGYVQGNGTVSINIPLWKFAPTLMFQPSGSFGGAAFYLINTDLDEDADRSTPSVNWDILWAAKAALVLSI